MTTDNKLKSYFPMLRTREAILKEIKERRELLKIFNTWKDYEQEEFLNFCTGAKCVKMTYDPFFKEIFNPELTPERLGDFLSQALKQKVKVLLVHRSLNNQFFCAENFSESAASQTQA